MDSCSDGSQEAKAPWTTAPSINTTNSSASVSTPSVARLPNECLHMIVDYLSTDIRTLHSLLLVNRFFFHTALPHLMTVLSWQDDGYTPTFLNTDISADTGGIAYTSWTTTTQSSLPYDEAEWTRRNQLLLVVLMSFLESRLLERQQQREAEGGEQEVKYGEQQGHGRVEGRESSVHRFSVVQEVEAVLEPFGMRLAGETIYVDKGKGNRGHYIRSSLAPRAAAMVRYLQGSEETTSADGRFRRRLSVDYSKYFSDPWGIEGWWQSNLCQLIHLCRVPEELQGGDSGDGQGLDIDDIDTGDKRDGPYAVALGKSFASMLFYHNLEHIKVFRIYTAKVGTYLPLADQMKSLKTIMPEDMDTATPLLSKIAQFIRQNQSAFPRKKPLDLDYKYIEYCDDVDNMDYDDPSILLRRDEIIEDAAEFQRLLRAFRAFKERQRLGIVETMRPYLELYKAIGRPRRMDIKGIPMAYEHLLRGSGDLGGDRDGEPGQEWDEDDAIGLDRLVELNDELLDRLDYGEGPFMEQFFRRCHRLQSLDLAVGHPELFSWAAADVLQRCTLSSPSPSPSPFCHPVQHPAILPCLQELNLVSIGPYRFLLQALNDAMTAFAPSLKSVSLKASANCFDDASRTHDHPTHRVHALRSLQLRKVASANTVGDWPFLLPRLTSMSLFIDAGVAVCFDTGTFAQAPNLETLILSVPMKSVPEQHQYEQQAGQGWQEEQGHGGDREDERGGGDSGEEDYTSAHWHGGKVLVDADQQEAKFNRTTLYPPWVLPRLKMLVLYGMPAARFDFRSLQSMKQLKELSMSMDNETERAFSVKEYMDLQRKTWEGHWREQDQRLEQGEGHEQGERQMQSLGHEQEWKEGIDRRDQLLQMWALPELNTLFLNCWPSTMFWLDWLTVCPKVQRANIWMWSNLDIPITRMPFFFSGDAYESSSYSSDSSSGSNDMEGDRSDKGTVDDAPLLNSQLLCFELRGTWAMPQQDLTSFLAVYAPFLRPLRSYGDSIMWDRAE
ncbi:hypothetical protein EDD11_008199 [Mortierella claussenii]|nr:hypothetical protein EDD11_008199 [Mortierella claussenii]